MSTEKNLYKLILGLVAAIFLLCIEIACYTWLAFINWKIAIIIFVMFLTHHWTKQLKDWLDK